MKVRLFGSLTLALASLLFLGCSSDNVMQDASQVSNLHEVDFSVFEKTLEDLPTRADDASGTPLSETNLFSELEVAMIPTNKLDDLSYAVRQLSTDDNFGSTKLYVPDGDYYLVAVAANTKNPVKGHQVTIKSTSEIDFADGKVTDMAYYYGKVTIDSKKKTSLSVPLQRGAACLFLNGVSVKPDDVTAYKLTLSGGVGKTFNPSTGCCTKEESLSLSYDLTPYQGKRIYINVYCTLTNPEVKEAAVTGTAYDKDDNVVKKISLSDVYLVRGKKTTYTGPLFTSTTGMGFTITQPTMLDVDSGHTFE